MDLALILKIFLTCFLSYVPQFTPLPPPVLKLISPPLCYDLPNNCIFNIVDIKVGLDKLKSVNNADPDGLPKTFLFNLRSFLSVPLWLIFRRSLDEGVFTSIWKLSFTHKSDDKSSVRNYRSISILSYLAKLYEKLLLKNILPSVNRSIQARMLSCDDLLVLNKGRFLSYAGHLLNISHPLHDYTPVLRELGLSTLTESCCQYEVPPKPRAIR